MFIVVKIKCGNFSNINNICDKLKFTTNYTHCTTSDYKKTHITIFDTYNGTGPVTDLSISA